MKRTLFACYALCTALLACASTTLPLRGNLVKPTDKNIQYVGRICFDNPERPRFTFPGTQINARFTGTSLRLIAKPKSGFFMAQIDQGEPFKVAFMGERDSVVTLATALPQGEHEVRLMYVVEGYDLKPSFWGLLLDSGAQLLPPPALSSKTMQPNSSGTLLIRLSSLSSPSFHGDMLPPGRQLPGSNLPHAVSMPVSYSHSDCSSSNSRSESAISAC